jgi:hypothetical protein
LSLRDQFREGLYDSEQKPRLNYARNYFLEFSLDKDIDFEELERFYVEWRDYDEYIVFQKQTDKLSVTGEIEKETVAIKGAKRGNDVYAWHLWNRLKFLYNLKNRSFFDPHGNIKLSNLLFVTLTYDVKLSTIREAWEIVGEEFNKWIRNLRKKFGRVSYLRCWEATKRGYPHVHLLMIFHDYEFRIDARKSKHSKYRIVEKEAFEKSWDSFVDVQAIRKMKDGIKYVTKYLSKSNTESQTHVLTFALCWLFRKRSFAVSGDLYDVIQASIGHRKMIQTNLMGAEVALNVVWVFIGIFSAKTLEITHNVWRKTITEKKVLNRILA